MSRYNGYLLNVVKPCMQPLCKLAQFSWIMETLNCSVMSKFFDDVCNSGGQLCLTNKLQHKFFTMSRDEYATFVEDTIQLVIQQFAEKNLM